MLTGISGSKMVLSASTIPLSTSEGSTGAVTVVAAGAVVSGSMVVSSDLLLGLLLGGNGLILRAFRQSRQQGVPGQGSALDPHGVLTDAGEDGELAELRVALAGTGGDQVLEDVEEPAGLLD